MTNATDTVRLPRTGVASPRADAAVDPRARHATQSLGQFAFISAQLVLLVWIIRAFQVEERAFLNLMGIATGGFLVHYWLPLRYKEPFWILLSLGGAVMLVGMTSLLLLLVAGLFFYVLLASRLSYAVKVGTMLALAVLLMVGRGLEVSFLPAKAWPILGALFMFRMVVYLYDLPQMKGRPSIQEYLAYFYPLPNFYFLLFPVIDLQTMRRTYYQRDIHLVAQQGLLWMARGVVQLLLYRLVYFLKPSFDTTDVVSFQTLAAAMVGTYLLYLRVSGQFHIVIGLMHLFGYDLPETHRKYLLASSITDFWRRINIYWKDFMVKVVYFPVYFRYRRSGDTRARVIATVVVFVATWALHSYQWFWLRGELLLSWTDTLFWAILGALVVVNLLMEQRAPKKAVTPAAAKPAAVEAGGMAMHIHHGLKVFGTLSLIIVLWSFWQSPTIEEWTTTMAWWNR
jgi:D-alanyl-lipoteichoic acid acyltransferase DltB (MBOAT superfamily)